LGKRKREQEEEEAIRWAANEKYKGIALSPPLNCKVILWSSLSLFKYY